jgi:hypothetical protein
VKLWCALRRLLPVLAVLGLVLAPFIVPAVAGGMSASTPAMTAGDGSAMGDMDCCRPERPVMPNCMKACPLPTMCLGNAILGVTSGGSLPIRIGLAQTLVPQDEAVLHTLAHGPPLRPPQA